MPAPQLRQYFGPSPRHPQACVELTVDEDPREFTLAPVIEAFAKAGTTFYSGAPEGTMALAEAVGRLTLVMLQSNEPSAMSHGAQGERVWTCISYPYPGVAATALMRAHRAILACHSGTEPSDERMRQFVVKPPPSRMATTTMIRIAAEMDLDACLVSRLSGIYQIGQGKAAKLFTGTSSEGDCHAGEIITANKNATSEVLRRQGLPATNSRTARSVDEVRRAVQDVGFPCVIKPSRGAMGRGVTTRIVKAEQIPPALEAAQAAATGPIIVENHIEGDDHRILVCNGKVLWVYKRSPAHVIGDGTSTLEQLVAAENRDRAEASATERAFVKSIAMDEKRTEFVRDRYGIGPEDVPDEGQRIDLAGQANIAQGGKLDDLSAVIHPENRRMAEHVARIMRIGMLGIDFMTTDISKPWHETGGTVIEVNCTPGIGGLRDGCLVQRSLFPKRLSGRVPTFVTIGDEAYREATGSALADALAAKGLNVHRAAYARGEDETRNTDISVAPQSPEIEAALLDVLADTIVVTAEPAMISAHGFPLQVCDRILAPGEVRGLSAPSSVVGAGDAGAIARIVDEVCTPYLDGSLGGPRPHVEPVAEESDAQALCVKVWRPPAMPREEFWDGWPAMPDTGDSSVSPADILAACVALANRWLEAEGAALIAGAFEMLDDDHSFGPPALRARIAAAEGLPAREALARAMAEVNERLGG